LTTNKLTVEENEKQKQKQKQKHALANYRESPKRKYKLDVGYLSENREALWPTCGVKGTMEQLQARKEGDS
jgi:hypothetical protein